MNSGLSAKTWFVYKHTSPSNKVYIGITSKSPNDRWASGFGYEHQAYFFRAIVKYGWINFKHEILFEGLTKEEAEAKEIELIARYNATDLNYGYNIDLGGNNHRLSVEARQNISKTKTGKKWSERQRLASIEYFKKNPGKKVYKYDLQGNLLKTYKCCKEAANEININIHTLRNYIWDKKFPSYWNCVYSYGTFDGVELHDSIGKGNSKPVDMYDLSLNYVRTFESIISAARFLKENNIKGSDRGIWKVCNGQNYTCGKYIWRYHNENTNNKIA